MRSSAILLRWVIHSEAQNRNSAWERGRESRFSGHPASLALHPVWRSSRWTTWRWEEAGEELGKRLERSQG